MTKINSTNTNENVGVGLQYSITEKIVSKVQIGTRKSKEVVELSKINGLSDSINKEEGKTYALSFDYRGLKHNVSFIANQQITPNSSGDINNNATFSLQYLYKQSQRTNYNVLFGNSTLKSGTNSTSNTSKYKWIEVVSGYNIKQKLNLSARYKYGERNTNNSSETSKSNLYLLSLNYSWSKEI
jgi:predicted porin